MIPGLRQVPDCEPACPPEAPFTGITLNFTATQTGGYGPVENYSSQEDCTPGWLCSPDIFQAGGSLGGTMSGADLSCTTTLTGTWTASSPTIIEATSAARQLYRTGTNTVLWNAPSVGWFAYRQYTFSPSGLGTFTRQVASIVPYTTSIARCNGPSVGSPCPCPTQGSAIATWETIQVAPPTATSVGLTSVTLNWINVAAKDIPALDITLLSTAQAPWYFKVRAGVVTAVSETGTTIVASGTLANVKSQLEAGGHFSVAYSTGVVVGSVLSSDFKDYDFVANKTTCANQVFLALKGEELNPKSGTVSSPGLEMWNSADPYVASIPNTKSAFLTAVAETRRIYAGDSYGPEIYTPFIPPSPTPPTNWVNRYSLYVDYRALGNSAWKADPSVGQSSSFYLRGYAVTTYTQTCTGPGDGGAGLYICGGPNCNGGCTNECSEGPTPEVTNTTIPAPSIQVSLVHSGGWSFT